MARLESKSYPWPEYDYSNWQESSRKEDALMAKLDKAAAELPEGEVKGAILRFPVADSYAVYIVTKARPLTLQHIPYCDAWKAHPALIRGIRKADVLSDLKRHRFLFAGRRLD